MTFHSYKAFLDSSKLRRKHLQKRTRFQSNLQSEKWTTSGSRAGGARTSNEAPFAEDRWKRIAKFAAAGQLPFNEHLSGVRTVLAVYKYTNTPEVVKRMRRTTRNVKTELRNFKHLTDNILPKNDKGVDIDLSAA